MQSFKELAIWRRSYQLALSVYRVTERFPRSERYALTSQMRRAAVSVPTNIAEGCRRRHRDDFARFLNISEGSLSELESLLMLATDLGYTDPEASSGMIEEVSQIGRMICRFRQHVELRGPVRKPPVSAR